VKRWWVVIALLLSVGVNVGLIAAVATRKIVTRGDRPADFPGPQGPPPLGPDDRGPGGEPLRFTRLADRLGLEGEPRRRFLAMQRQLFEETLNRRMHLAETQREVRREMASADPDRARIDSLLKEAARDFLILEQALATNVLATRDILTPRQEQEYLRIISRLRPLGPGGLDKPPLRRRPPPMRKRLRDRFEPPEDEGPPPEVF
jgi:Spy/CpxP family protein refolding chaperone